MPDFLERALLTVAFCWRLERRDGVALGFTTHDRDLRRAGLVYRAAPGMLPSSISITDGFDAESLDVEGALTSDAISAADLTAGCRARLGDRRCRVDMAGRTRVTRIVAIPGEDLVEVAEAGAGDEFGFGRLRWLGGPNSGLASEILRSAGALLTLAEPPAFSPVAGDLVEISEGCDRILATCAGRFANAANFRGEPHLPGMDLLTRYPGA